MCFRYMHICIGRITDGLGGERAERGGEQREGAAEGLEGEGRALSPSRPLKGGRGAGGQERRERGKGGGLREGGRD